VLLQMWRAQSRPVGGRVNLHGEGLLLRRVRGAAKGSCRKLKV